MLDNFSKVVVANTIVPMDELLDYLGVDYQGVPGSLRCPIHNPNEVHPSARIYEERKSVYCFACSRQFYPVDIASAVLGIDRVLAAEQLLIAWGYDDSKPLDLAEIRRNSPDPEMLLYHDFIEQALLRKRGILPLQVYRSKITQVDAFKQELITLPASERYAAVDFFVRKL